MVAIVARAVLIIALLSVTTTVAAKPTPGPPR